MESIIEEIKNAFKKPNNGNIQLIIINLAVFLLAQTFYIIGTLAKQQLLFEGIINYLFALPSDLMTFAVRPWTLFTYFFAHSLSDIFHILGNMLMLYYFGALFIDFLGHRRFINLYILGGIAGGVLYLIAYNTIPYFIHQKAMLVGASASVLAIVVGTATVVPNYEFFLFGLIRIKIKWIALFYVVSSYLGIIGHNSGGEIAHLGGIFMGWYFVSQIQKGTDLGKWISMIFESVKALFSNKPKMKASQGGRGFSSSATTTKTSKPTQAQIDVILDKIAKSGYSSLSAEEKQILFQASNEK